MKKLLCNILILLILFNFIIPNLAYAEPGALGSGTLEYSIFKDKTTGDVLLRDSSGRLIDEDGNVIPLDAQGNPTKEPVTDKEKVVSPTGVQGMMHEGQVESPAGQTTTLSSNNFGNAVIASIAAIITIIIDFIPFTINILMTLASSDNDFTTVGNNVGSEGDEFFFTIDRVVFNRLPLFNINFFNTGSSYSIGIEGTSSYDEFNTANASNRIKESVQMWFAICRLIALAVGLLVLIYIGIRMAISTIASEEAKYKKMLISWVESVVILFFLPYIMMAMIAIGEMLLNMCVHMRSMLIDARRKKF